MGLDEYRKKRDFNSTPEPGGVTGKKRGRLRFVVQRHDARRLHYDLRLEMEGVLKSWAVPKGPSMNPSDKRLAIHTEDHPVKYLDFEGTIPKGNYGAGEMRIWDRGTYSSAPAKVNAKAKDTVEHKDAEHKDAVNEDEDEVEAVNEYEYEDDIEKSLIEQLEKGSLKIVFSGKKLKGGFALVSMNQEDQWLLIKKDDRHAIDMEYDAEDLAGNSPVGEMEETTEETEERVDVNYRGSDAEMEEDDKNEDDNDDKHDDGNGGKSESEHEHEKGDGFNLKEFVKPMLAKKTTGIFEDPEWVYELKWDGYRVLANLKDGSVQLYSRNGISFNKKFLPVVEGLKTIRHDAILDGEIVYLDEDGKPVFQKLQNYSPGRKGRLRYYVFDLLHLNGHNTMGLTLLQRKSLIPDVIEDAPRVMYSGHISGNASGLFKKAVESGLEGVIAKKSGSKYFPGTRSDSWLKIKSQESKDALICGYTEGKRVFGSLILGVYELGELTYTGNCGTGFNEETQRKLVTMMKPLRIKKNPFEKKINLKGRKAIWVKPEIICEVVFSAWTESGLMRHPVFKGLRKDKAPEEITREKEVMKPATREKNGQGKAKAKKTGANVKKDGTDKMEKKKKNKPRKSDTKKKIAPDENEKKGENLPVSTVDTENKKMEKTAPEKTDKSEASVKKNKSKKNGTNGKTEKSGTAGSKSTEKGDNTLEIDGISVAVTNLDKVYWPDEGFTKYDLIDYYLKMSDVMLPYLTGRPQNLNRHPDGIHNEGFYQKDSGPMLPDWVDTISIYSESTGKDIEYMLCQNTAALVYMANLGCIEINPWNSKKESLDKPDYTVIDIDPPAKTTFQEVIEVAQAASEVLDRAGIQGYCKTSGSRGMHIYLPVNARYSYEEARNFTKLLCYYIKEVLPGLTTMERSPGKRKGKIYLDYLQNRKGQTLAAPYCLRPRKGATASAPLKWSEVKKGLDMNDFNIHTMPGRIESMTDPFKRVLGKGIDIQKALKVLGEEEG